MASRLSLSSSQACGGTFVMTILEIPDSLGLLQARTVIPDWSPDNPWSELQRLGSRPLGEILFRNSGLERSEFEFTLGPGWRAPETPPGSDQLARRCVYRRLGAALLLTERFLRIEP